MLNYISVNASKLFNSLIGFSTQYFLIRIFIPNDIGIIVYLSSISSILSYFSDFGLTNFSRRVLPSLSSNNQDFYSYVVNLLLKKLIVLIIFVFCLFFANLFFNFFNTLEFIIILVLTFNLTTNSKFIFESKSNFIFFSIFETFIKILSLILIILFTYFHFDDYYSYFLIFNFIQLFFSILINCYFFTKVKKIGIKNIFDFSDLSKSFPYLIPSLYSIVFGSLDRIFIINLSDALALFIHSQAIFITSHLITFSTSLSSINSPQATKVYSQGNLNRFIELIQSTIQNINLISFPIIIGFSILINDFSQLFFNSYSHQIRITSTIIIWDILFNGIFYLQMEQILLGMRRITYFNKILIYSTLSLMPLYFIFIPLFGYIGAAISIVIGRIIAVIIANIFINKLNLPKFKYIIFKYIILSITMGAMVILVKFINISMIFSILLQILTGVLFYTLLIYLFDKSSISKLTFKK